MRSLPAGWRTVSSLISVHLLRRNICRNPHKNHHHHHHYHSYYCRRRRFCGAIRQYTRTTSFVSSLRFVAQICWPCTYCLMAGRSAEVSQNLNNLLFAIWWVHSLHRWDREVVLRAAAAAVLVLEDETDIRSVAGMLEDVSWFFFFWYLQLILLLQSNFFRPQQERIWRMRDHESSVDRNGKFHKLKNPALLFPTVTVCFHSAINNLPELQFNWNFVVFIYKLLNQLFALVSFCSKIFYTLKIFLHLLKH